MTANELMTWPQAVDSMRAGAFVRRKSQMVVSVISEAGSDGPEIVETGQEGCYLAHAWTDDNKAVRVFMGASSKCLFVPDGEDMEATDWVAVERKDA